MIVSCCSSPIVHTPVDIFITISDKQFFMNVYIYRQTKTVVKQGHREFYFGHLDSVSWCLLSKIQCTALCGSNIPARLGGVLWDKEWQINPISINALCRSQNKCHLNSAKNKIICQSTLPHWSLSELNMLVLYRKKRKMVVDDRIQFSMLGTSQRHLSDKRIQGLIGGSHLSRWLVGS